MPRNISFSMTTQQIRDKSKTVTRRRGWANLQLKTKLIACVKCMGLKKGQQIERIGLIEVLDVKREALGELLKEPYGSEEARKEGFPELTGEQFAKKFIADQGGDLNQIVTRIEFKHIREEASQ